MRYLTVHPDYQATLANAGLRTPEDVLRLHSVIFCGHPSRNVARASIPCSEGAVRLLIKREHVVTLKERFANLAGGFGFVSKSHREAATIDALKSAGIRVPRWIAHGADQTGCAFLVLEECVHALDVRRFLQTLPASQARSVWTARLGRDLAMIHQAGFDHPDLYSKHVLVRHDGTTFFIDWQRTRLRTHVNWRARVRGLARLNATMPETIATSKERWRCLAAYLASCRASGEWAPDLGRLGRAIHAESLRISKRRRLREQAKVRNPETGPLVTWLDGEALCTTAELAPCLEKTHPIWLALANLPDRPAQLELHERVNLEGVGNADLTRRRQRNYSHWWRRLTGRERPSSPELRHAGILFRLEKIGMPVPRVLAFGQRFRPLGQMESFVLRSRPTQVQMAFDWLREWSLDGHVRAARCELIRQAGGLLRQLHRANFYLDSPGRARADAIFAVDQANNGEQRIVLDQLDRLISLRHECQKKARQDLVQLRGSQSGKLLTRTDHLRFLLAYSEANRFDDKERVLWRQLSRQSSVRLVLTKVFGF
jgi:tRNA A-37 threonylcarbamoyl transferase component Bud32